MPLLNLEGTVVTPFGVGGNWALTVHINAAKMATTANNAIEKRIQSAKFVNVRIHVGA
jgi:hypothetical protein